MNQSIFQKNYSSPRAAERINYTSNIAKKIKFWRRKKNFNYSIDIDEPVYLSEELITHRPEQLKELITPHNCIYIIHNVICSY